MESELELHEAIQELHAVATVPDLYPIMVQLNAISSLLELLSHENTDISVGVVDLLQELTDVDILNESAEGAEALVEALVSQQATSLLLHNLQRLDETVKEEADGVHNTLEHVVSIIAAMLRNCRGPQRARLLSKFTENDHEKVDRLLELHFKYIEKVDIIDTEIERLIGSYIVSIVFLQVYKIFDNPRVFLELWARRSPNCRYLSLHSYSDQWMDYSPHDGHKERSLWPVYTGARGWMDHYQFEVQVQ
ncbi:unnamed protein product [Nesidiocoris tenuis]|uniref:Beta-catenin-like protein 1 N-terminal domain-containing protein n=1 Tax=Nesidiocoris tenuis TaxID=355587 RepID=A0A6H5G3G0_9HEMI|nr:unnamed protein product [Nesidiocoris tenuis]